MNLLVSLELSPALQIINLVLFEEVLNATSQTTNTLVLGRLHLIPVDANLSNLNAVILEVVQSIVVLVGSVQKSF